MKLISGINEIKRNLEQLDRYRRSPDPKTKKFYNLLIKRGICFVVTEKKGGRLCFGPSRFVGYNNNNFKKHKNNTKKNGTRTNKAIEEFSGRAFKKNAYLEKQYVKLCVKQGFETPRSAAFRHLRRYMII